MDRFHRAISTSKEIQKAIHGAEKSLDVFSQLSGEEILQQMRDLVERCSTDESKS